MNRILTGLLALLFVLTCAACAKEPRTYPEVSATVAPTEGELPPDTVPPTAPAPEPAPEPEPTAETEPDPEPVPSSEPEPAPAPAEALNENESLIVEALQRFLSEHPDYSGMHVTVIGEDGIYDSLDCIGLGAGTFFGVKVQMAGTDASGAPLVCAVLIRLERIMTNRAWIDARINFDSDMEYWKKDWDETPSDEYPRYLFATFADWREHFVEFIFDTYFFVDEESAIAAATAEFDDYSEYYREIWDKAADNKYPKLYYATFEDYRESYIQYELDSYSYPYPDKDTLSEYVLYMPLADSDILYHPEGEYNIDKINRALTDMPETAQIPEPVPEPDPVPVSESGTRVDIDMLKGSICIPEGYYAFGADLPYTDEMLRNIGVLRENFEQALPLLAGQILIVPANEPYADSLHYYVKVKEKKYQNITLSELSSEEYNMLASAVVNSFHTDTYDTVTGNGLKFFVFNADMGMGNVCRYATILNGHMIYVYLNTGSEAITPEQQAVLESIALSIQHGL